MRFSLFVPVLSLILTTSAPAAEKTLSEYWKGTELTWSVLEGELSNKTCRSSVEKFMGCISAADAVVKFANPKLELVVSFSPGRGRSVQRFGILRVNEVGKSDPPAEKFLDRYKANQAREKALRELWTEAFLKQGEHVAFDEVFTWIGKQLGAENTAEAVGIGMNAFLHVSRDPHSRIQPFDFIKSLRDKSTLEYSGVGMMISPFENSVMALIVFEGTPAQKAGIQPYDVINKVNDRATKGMDILEVASMLRQTKGTKLKLDITREGKDKQIELVADDVTLKHVSHSMLTDENRRKMGYLQIRTFDSSKICKEVGESVRSLLKDGAEGIILDLRNNGGGLADQAVCVAGLFLEKGKTVYSSQALTSSKREPAVTKTEPLTNLPMIVLVNSSSASAAEVLAGALQDHGRALVVGIRTYGKGNGQELEVWKKSDKVILAETRFYAVLPAGTVYQLIGIFPDFKEVYARPEPTEMDKFTPREGDIYFNPVRLAAVRERTAPRETDRSRKLQECVDKGQAGARYAAAREDRRLDFQLLTAQDALDCVIANP